MFADVPCILNLALPEDTSAVNVPKSVEPVLTTLSLIVASVPAELTVKVISEFWYSVSAEFPILIKYLADLYLNASNSSIDLTVESTSPNLPYNVLSTSPNFVLDPKSCLYNIAVPVVFPVDTAVNVNVADEIVAAKVTW